MTTIKAVSATEVEVNNNGRVRRVPVAALIALDETLASCVRFAVQAIGQDVKVPGDNRRPRHARVHGLLQ